MYINFATTFHYLHIIVPVPSVTVKVPNNQTVGQPLILECDVTTVRGITSSVDIVWSSDNSELNTVRGVEISSTINDTLLFTNTYSIPQLTTADENKEYQCEVFIDTETPVIATNIVMLNVTGKNIIIIHKIMRICTYILHL